MRQASRALALCRAMPEFSGSAEQVEGERLLLLAAERQQACLAEAERLKTQGGCAGQGQSPAGRASLTLSCLELPLRKDFLAAQLQGALGGDVHHFVCLVKQGPHVLASQMLSTAGGQSTLRFTNHMTLLDLAPDFLVTVHVCALQTKKETLPHDRKYRIGTKAKLKLTPRVDKTSGKTGGQAVDCGPLRPSFGLVGVVHLTLANWRRSTFHLDKVPAHSPLEGTLLAQLKLRPQQHPQVRGFLTMFEDVGGLGAWHRRWCLLAKNRLSFWRYPEDEGIKEPKGWLDLHESSDMDSRLVSRDVCARPHTLALAVAGVQRLLSADTREEAKRWCAGLNAALHWTRTWAC
uniref:Putative actin-binding protein n=1 Tax=Ixodes ricinus TaxID=34613 RepID=A0A131XTS5_IXORI